MRILKTGDCSGLLCVIALLCLGYACSCGASAPAGTDGLPDGSEGNGNPNPTADSGRSNNHPVGEDSSTGVGSGADSATDVNVSPPQRDSSAAEASNGGDGSTLPVPTEGGTDGGGDVAGDAAMHVGPFIHPGLLLRQADLDRIRTNVAAGMAPWSTAWAALKNADAGTGYQPSVSASITDSYAIQAQGHAAWVLAVKWVASGDMAYAMASQRILDAWVNTVTSMQTTTLRTGVGSMQMANAAEIMGFGFNGAAGWPAAQVTKARTWFKSVVWPRIGMGNAQRSSNWGTSAMAGCMATAIFADDPAKFDYSVSAFKNGFTDGPDGCSGVTQYICDATGQATEAGRDQGHAQGGVAHLVEVAMMAWNQGTNLVPYANGRLVAGMEYLAQYNTNNSVPYDPNFPDPCHVHPRWMVISPIGRGSFSPIYEMANKLFTLDGAAHPFTSQVIASSGYQPEGTNSDHCGLGTLIMR